MRSPFLRVASGEVKIEKFKRNDAMDLPSENYKFKIKVEDTIFDLEGHIPQLKEEIRDILKTMGDCYHEGLTLNDASCHWIFNEDIIQREDIDYII